MGLVKRVSAEELPWATSVIRGNGREKVEENRTFVCACKRTKGEGSLTGPVGGATWPIWTVAYAPGLKPSRAARRVFADGCWREGIGRGS